MVKRDRKAQAAINETKVLREETKLRLEEANELFNTEERGYIQVEHERERTLKVTQEELKKVLPMQAKHDIFDLRLPDFGPYSAMDITRNGAHLLLGGKKGHIAMFDWKRKNLVCEFQAKERVNAVCFLQNHNMFAAAQGKYMHIYDS